MRFVVTCHAVSLALILASCEWDIRLACSVRIDAVTGQIRNFHTALEAYREDTGHYPSAAEGLRALQVEPAGTQGWQGPYLPQDAPLDMWGRPYQYRLDTRGKPVITIEPRNRIQNADFR